MFGHVEVEDSPALVGEDDQDEEHVQARGGDGEKIERDQVPDVVGEELAPGLGRRGVPRAWAGISGGAEPGSFRTGSGSVLLRANARPDRRPTDESTSRPEGEDDHPGTGKPGTGPD